MFLYKNETVRRPVAAGETIERMKIVRSECFGPESN